MTTRTEKGEALIMGDFYPNETAARADLMKRYMAAIDRLAAHEDTGLEPEEYKKHADALKKLDIEHMHDLLQADQDGRLVVTPCKVGDTVYVTYGEGYRLHIVDRIYIAGNQEVQVRMRNPCTMSETLRLNASNFGKTVFLTREEAEAAMKEER